MLGPLLTNWTIRLALAAYALWLALWLCQSQNRPASQRSGARWLYSLAWVLFLAHVACAFHFFHDWSHQAAFEDTARKTEAMLGFAFGEGIYCSYVFTLLWGADVAWLWIWPASRIAWLTFAIQLYMAFIALNGAVVFEAGITRWVGIPVAIVLAGLAAWRCFLPRSALPAADSA